MNILEVYKKYNIPKNLGEHQFRVASVAQMIVASSQKSLDIDLITKSCLLHDMGNIIKFNLNLFPEALGPEGIQYWSQIQESFISKYGSDEHKATIDIARELRSSKEVLYILEQISFANSEFINKSDNFELKIVSYSDSRVGPFGVLSLKERFEDGYRRYNKNKPNQTSTLQKNIELHEFVKDTEKQIFDDTTIDPEDINDISIKNIFQKMSKFDL